MATASIMTTTSGRIASRGIQATTAAPNQAPTSAAAVAGSTRRHGMRTARA